MSPNKGGIDHSPSSFRVIEFNPKGDLKSHLKYSPIERHVVANGFWEINVHGYTPVGYIRKTPESGFMIIANIYDTPTEVEKAVVLVDEKEYPLIQKSSWSWFVRLPSNIVGMRAAAGGAKIMVKFSDGSVVVNPVVVNCGGFDNSVCGAAQQPAGASAAGSLASAQPVIRWATNMGGNTFMTSPLLAGNLVISATTDDDSASVAAIHALGRTLGDIRWSFKTKNSVKNNMALWEGTIFACDVEGTVYAIDAASGKLKWSKALRQNSVHPVYTQGVVVSNGVIYAGQGNFLPPFRLRTARFFG